MYGLPQAGILANKLLKGRLLQNDYFEVPHTLGLFWRKTRPVWFTLTVEDFGIKCIGKEHAQHLLNVLKELYEIEEGWTSSLYCGITLDWHYDQQYVDISMVNYVLKQLANTSSHPRKIPNSAHLNQNQYNMVNNQTPYHKKNQVHRWIKMRKSTSNRWWEVFYTMPAL